MNILIIDAKGGGLGKQLVTVIKRNVEEAVITAAGTNSLATEAMRKAGADNAATGENAIIVCSRNADIIVGSVGIAMADTMGGEITPAIALAICKSRAKRIFLPMNQQDSIFVGLADLTIKELMNAVVEEIRAWNDL